MNKEEFDSEFKKINTEVLEKYKIDTNKAIENARKGTDVTEILIQISADLSFASTMYTTRLVKACLENFIVNEDD